MTTGTIGVEETTRYFVTENVGKAAAAASIVSGTPVTAGCRSVKSPHEIELMQIANDITAHVFAGSLKALKDGLTEREFGSTLTKMFSEFGVTGGALVLFGYGLTVNSPGWTFGRMLGVYIAVFFLISQLLAHLVYHEHVKPPTIVGGALIVAGGLVIAFWRVK